MNDEEIIKEFKDLIYNPNYDEILLRCEDGFTGWHELFKNVLDLYQQEKEKNIELQNYMKEYLIPKSTINLLYISKDKIKKLLDKYVGCYMKFYEKIQELLEEE